MPVNLDALIRYHTIDQCLQNRFKKWTCEDLAKACFESLDEVRLNNSDYSKSLNPNKNN
jgi:hypothetical protein